MFSTRFAPFLRKKNSLAAINDKTNQPLTPCACRENVIVNIVWGHPLSRGENKYLPNQAYIYPVVFLPILQQDLQKTPNFQVLHMLPVHCSSPTDPLLQLTLAQETSSDVSGGEECAETHTIQFLNCSSPSADYSINRNGTESSGIKR